MKLIQYNVKSHVLLVCVRQTPVKSDGLLMLYGGV